MKFLNMERRQKYIEEILKRQQRQIFKVSKELEIHREFLNLQFESFMDFLFQNGGQVIQLSGKNGKEEETGVFFPMKKARNGEGKQDGDENDQDDAQRNGEERDEQANGDDDGLRQDEEDDREDIMEELPPPQAILGSPSGDEAEVNEPGSKKNGNMNQEDHFGGQSSSSRRSSHNVVSSTDAQNDDDEYDDVDEYDSTQPEVMKYDMNHFMFSHFLDGGGEENEMDESYNDNDEEAGMYDNEDVMDVINPRRSAGTSRQWSNNGVGRNLSTGNLPQMKAKPSSNNLPLPASNIPHNERTCRYCGKTFHWKQSWVIHERTHTGEKPYLCKCGKAFSQKSNMNTHAKSCAHATTQIKGKTTVFQMSCGHCQKQFSHKKGLDLHMEKFHPEVLNLSVKNSSSSSSPISNFHLNGSAMMEAELAAAAARAAENAAILQILKNASDNHPPVDVSLSPSINHNSNSNSSTSGDDRNGRYPCSYCPKRFPVKGTLERHLRVHTGEKPFLCGVCGKSFTQKGSVKLHLERVHQKF